jgi:hydroxymethylbilane synthase
MKPVIKIGTRESALAVWQAELVRSLLADQGYTSTLVYIKSEGDIDLETPLYEMGVQGIFTKSLDSALLNNRIDIAVHSMKDVPTQLPEGIAQAAILKRGNHKDLFVVNEHLSWPGNPAADNDLPKAYLDLSHLSSAEDSVHPYLHSKATVATSSTRRKAQWLHRYPAHTMVNLRGNVNTRVQKVAESTWQGAIFAAAGLERIGLRPASAVELDWMLPAPTQGAIMVVCRTGDIQAVTATLPLNHAETAACTGIEKDFLRGLMGGCTTPIGALAIADKKDIFFRGNILTTDGKQKIEIEKYVSKEDVAGFGLRMAQQILSNGGREIADTIRNAQ